MPVTPASRTLPQRTSPDWWMPANSGPRRTSASSPISIRLTSACPRLCARPKTRIRYLDPDVKGKSQQGYLWVYSRPKSDVLFEWRISRSREGPEEFLKKFRGKLQTDGYGAYESLAKQL